MTDYTKAASTIWGNNTSSPALDKTGLSLEQAVRTPTQQFKLEKTTANILGSDVQYVRQRKEEANRMARMRELNLQELRTQTPKTNKWLAVADNAAIAHDDVENLSAFEHTMNAIGASVDRVQSGLENDLADVLDFSNYVLSPVIDMPHTISDNLRSAAKANMSWVKKVDASRENLPYLGRMALAGIESVAPSVFAAAITFLTRSPAAGMASFALPTFGNEKQKAVDQGMNQFDATIHGAAQGMLEGFTEMLGVSKLLSAVKDKSGFVKTMGNFVGAQLYGEEINTIAGNFESWAVLPENKDKSFMDYANEQPSAMVDTFWQTLFGAGATGGIVHSTAKAAQYGADKLAAHMQKKADKLHQDMQDVGKALQDKQALDRGVEIMTQESKLHKLSPEDAYRFAKDIVGDKTVSLKAEDAETFFQENEDVLYSLRETSPDAYAAYERSQLDGSDMTIGMDEYIANFNEYHAFLSDKLHINGNDMNAKDAEEHTKTIKERLKSEADKVFEGVTGEFAQSANEVQDTIAKKLESAGRFTKDTAQVNATLFTQMVASTSKEMGILPHEFMQQFPLRVSNGGEISFINPVAQDITGFDAMVHKVRSGRVPTDSDVHGQSLLEFLHKKGGLQDQNGELSNKDLPKKYIKKKGNNLDKAARLAEEAGYLDERDINKLLEALDSELAGDKIYSPHNHDSALFEEQRILDDIQQAIGDRDIAELSNADIKQLIYGDFQQFIGENAAWDKVAAAQAVSMEKEGKNRDAIWDATGAFRGVDGKWRQELDSSVASLKKPYSHKGQLWGDIHRYMLSKGKYTKLSDLLDFPSLFKTSPDLANISITTKEGKGGSYYRGTGVEPREIAIGEDESMADVASILLHELQHAIQNNEGFAKGGIPKMFEKTSEDLAKETWSGIILASVDDKNSLDSVLKEVKDEVLNRHHDDATYSSADFKVVLELHTSKNPRELLEKWKAEGETPIDPYKSYRNLAGEVEARNVQARMHLSGNSRRLTRPWESQDTPDNIQTNPMGKSFSQQAKEYGIPTEEAKRQYDEVVSKYKGTTQWMKAPNGKPTNLNERQWVQTRTPAFKAWFGDWEKSPDKASKVVDENGEPMAVYHGTSAEFNVFDKDKFNSVEPRGDYVGEGFYFSKDNHKGFKYAKQAGGDRIIQGFLNIKNPFIPPSDYFDNMTDNALESYFESKPSEIRKEKQLNGYDGLIDKKYGQFATFNPNQIKSATGNTGQFDGANDNILYQEDGLPIEDIYEEQIQVDGQWFHADRVFNLDVNKLSIGDRVSLNSPNKNSKTHSNGEVEYEISSDLFQESGANISHNDETISKYEAAMRQYGGWGDFPPITGVMQTIDEDDIANQDELSFSRPLENSDIGKKFVQIDNGHNRAYAAARLGIDIKFIDPSELIDKKNDNILYQKESAPRGFINFGEGVNTGENVITLLADSNLSTFIHESAHLFFELRAHLAGQAGASDNLKADIKTLLSWGGIDSLEQWHAMSRDEQRSLHEKVARGFESYLMEGKAPIAELKGVFSRMRSWMISVYQSLNSLNVSLNDEVRQVFDRFVATDEALQDAKDAQNLSPLFETQEESGMSDTDWQLHLKSIEDAQLDGEAELSAKAVKDLKYLDNAKSSAMKKLQREGKEARKAVKQEVTDEVMAQKVNKLRSFLSSGSVPPELQTHGVKPMKLDTNVLKEMYGDDPIRLKITNNMKAKKDGTHPDVVAAWFGYESGDAMVRDIADSPKAKEVIQEETDKRVLERHGDMYTHEQIEKAAMEVVHATSMRKVIAQELNALDKIAGRKAISLNDVRDYAREIIARLMVNDASKSAGYLRAERKAAKAAHDAIKKSNTGEAAKQKQAQLFQQYLYTESIKAEKEIAKILRYVKKFNKKSTVKNLDAEYVDQLAVILNKYDFHADVTLKEQNIKELAQRGDLHKWIASETEKVGMKPQISDSVLNRATQISYKHIPLEELRGVYDALKTIENFGRNKKSLMVLAKKEQLHIAAQNIADSLDENNTLSDLPDVISPSFKQAVSHKLGTMGASLLNIEAVFRRLDGDKLGSLWQTLFKPLSDAGDRAFSRKAEVAKEFRELIESLYSKKERMRFGGVGAKRYAIAGLSDGVTKETIVSVAANYGSETGRQRVLNDFTEWQVKLMFDHLDDKDVQLIEHMWNAFEEKTWHDLRELEREINGVAPEKVAALPFTVGGKQLKGGYYPIKYDPSRSTGFEDIDETQKLEDMMGGLSGGSITTKQGAAKARQKFVKYKLRYDLGVFGEGIDEIIQDVEMRRPVIDAYRLMKNPLFADRFKRAAGTVVYDELKPWLADIAVPPKADAGAIARTFSVLRNHTAIVAMGLSVKTAAINITGYLQSFDADDVGVLRIAKHTALFFKNPMFMKAMQDEVFAMSAYMANRANTFDRDVRSHTNSMSVKGTLTPKGATWFYLLAVTDKAVSIPTWRAAYEAEMERSDNNHGKAIDFADHIVRSTQGGGREIDLAMVQRGRTGNRELYKAFTMFYSFFNATLQRNIRSVALLKKNGITDIPRFISSLFLLNVLPATLGAMMAGYGADDDEDKLKWGSLEVLKFMSGQIPFARDIIGAGVAHFGGEYFPYRATPILSSATDAVMMPFSIASDLIDGEADEQTLKKSILTTGIYLGLPSRQVWRTTQHLLHVDDGESDFSPFDLLMGEKYKPK